MTELKTNNIIINYYDTILIYADSVIIIIICINFQNNLLR